ncbi:MAG: FeoB-associated Cys-rich membrane protein [Treponema sp.]|nr:FeoB-associated Cys-rich membrane protein [Treponema sp.]
MSTIIVAVILAVIVAAIIRKMIKDKLNGKNSCSCGCQGCSKCKKNAEE